MRRLFIGVGLMLGPLACFGDTIYLCRAYSGGEFWAEAHCHKHKALIQRISTVPDGLPFSQQVAIAQNGARESAKLSQPPAPQTYQQTSPSSTSAINPQCVALANQAKRIDEVASKPQTAYMQDALAKEKRDVRSRQAMLRCG